MKKSCTTSELWIGFLVLFFCAFNLLGNVSASIHEYKDEQFVRKFNAFFFHGGTEGLYASKSSSIAYPHKPLEGKSFISPNPGQPDEEGGLWYADGEHKTALIDLAWVGIVEKHKIGRIF
ncbi:hypothetical protein FXO37_21187 [Capsicum annuum]|nr:hypothetical protein FXO37_21187 [Capsicum annuum]